MYTSRDAPSDLDEWNRDSDFSSRVIFHSLDYDTERYVAVGDSGTILRSEIAPPDKPDLIVQAVSGSHDSIVAGGSFTVSFNVTNIGTKEAEGDRGTYAPKSRSSSHRQ